MCVDVIERVKERGIERERKRERERERVWKGEDRGRKGGIPPPKIITQENDAKEGHKIITQENDAKDGRKSRTQNYYLVYTNEQLIEILRI